MSSRQPLFDAFLLFNQPVKGSIKVLLINGSEFKHLSERTGCGLRIEQSSRRRLGARVDEAGDNHGHAQLHLTLGLPPTLRQQAIKPDLVKLSQGRCNVAMGQTALHDQSVWAVGSDSLTAQHTAQRFNLVLAPVRQIGERSPLDFAAVAIALPQHNRGRGSFCWECARYTWQA